MSEWIDHNTETGIITINVHKQLEEMASVQCLNNDGSIFKKFVLEKNVPIQIDTNCWPQGTWFVRVEKKQEVQLKRILITK